MKSLKRVAVAVLAIAGSVQAAQPPATTEGARGPRVEQASATSAPVPTGDTTRMTATELEQRVQTLERELARLRTLEDAQGRLPAQPDPEFYW